MQFLGKEIVIEKDRTLVLPREWTMRQLTPDDIAEMLVPRLKCPYVKEQESQDEPPEYVI